MFLYASSLRLALHDLELASHDHRNRCHQLALEVTRCKSCGTSAGLVTCKAACGSSRIMANITEIGKFRLNSTRQAMKSVEDIQSQ